MATLYELSTKLRDLVIDLDLTAPLVAAEAEDKNEVAILDNWMKEVASEVDEATAEFEAKVELYVKVFRQLEADAEAVKAEEQRFRERRKTLENHANRLREHLTHCMLTTVQPDTKGRLRVDTTIAKVWLQKSPLSIDVDGCDPLALPEQYVTFEPKIKAKEILAHIRETGEIPEGAALKRERWHAVIR